VLSGRELLAWSKVGSGSEMIRGSGHASPALTSGEPPSATITAGSVSKWCRPWRPREKRSGARPHPGAQRAPELQPSRWQTGLAQLHSAGNLERCRPRHPYPQGSQGGIRKVEIIPALRRASCLHFNKFVPDGRIFCLTCD
jgi:hypothetical protein